MELRSLSDEELDSLASEQREAREHAQQTLRDIARELDRRVNAVRVDEMSPELKRQVLEAAGVESKEAFGKLGI